MTCYNIYDYSKEHCVRTGSTVEAATSLYNSTAQTAVSFRANAARSENLKQC